MQNIELLKEAGIDNVVIGSALIKAEDKNDMINKLEKTSFHTIPSRKVNAPIIEELPLTLECRMKSYQDEIMFVEIVNVSVDEKILTECKVDIDKLQPITFDPAHQTYRQIGAVVGRAFQDGNLLK